jgi:pyruvate formate lyase activating enzyme
MERSAALKEAMLYRAGEDSEVDCYLCNHHCRIGDTKFGFCGVRQNLGGILYTHAYGRLIAANVDPIEKKPLYHFLPGTSSFSVATIGCNFRCGFCQNWQISQASKREGSDYPMQAMEPQEIVRRAVSSGSRSIAYTYTEPTIFFEYAHDTAMAAKQRGLANVFVTNGYMTGEALETISPYLDACNVDLKSFSDDFYKKVCHGRLQPVLDSIRKMRQLDIWVEATTLVVPGSNDDEKELADIAGFLAATDPDIPWHISRFHPDYEFTSTPPTPMETLQLAYSLGREAGLHYVYLGNVLGEGADTQCPRCQAVLIGREGFRVRKNRIDNARCPECGSSVAGVFD